MYGAENSLFLERTLCPKAFLHDKLHNARESVFEKLPFLTLSNKNVWSLSCKKASGHKVFSKTSEFIAPYINYIIKKDPVPYSRLLSRIQILAVFQNLRWNSNKTSL